MIRIDILNNKKVLGLFQKILLTAGIWAVLNYAGDLINKYVVPKEPKQIVVSQQNQYPTLAEKINSLLNNEIFAQDIKYIGNVPFKKKEYDFPKFNLYDVEFNVAINPEKYQDEIMSWLPIKKEKRDDEFFSIKEPFKSYNGGNHIIMWYNSKTMTNRNNHIIGLMILAKKIADRIKEEYGVKLDLYLIDISGFNEENQFKVAKETHSYYYDHRRYLSDPALDIYYKGFRVVGYSQDPGAGLYKKDIQDAMRFLFDDRKFLVERISYLPKKI